MWGYFSRRTRTEVQVLTLLFQGRLLPGQAGRVSRGRADVRYQDHRQEGAQGEGGLFGERDQSSQKVFIFHINFSLVTKFP